MYKAALLSLILFATTIVCYAQRTQTIKGTIVDKETQVPLIGVSIGVVDLKVPLGTVTDVNGHYAIHNVPVGKHTIRVSYIGYQPLVIPNVLVTSAKEVVLPIALEQSAVNMKDVTVKGKREHINDMALVSAKTFDVQETERYAGSRGDPARMASNFAGVQGGDDSRNDIIIRGNSPQGVLWRVEGIDIPNPNHFAVPGTSGGPVSMLNDKTLGNSDFFTGAFPAAYGDAVAGVFDLQLRNGNSDRYEFTGQLGLLGTEVDAEGPISRKHGSSFLFAYRYSTLQIFQGLHIKIGTTSIPKYQDLTFKLNFPIGKKADLSVFGIGGLSNIDLIVSTLTEPTSQLYGESDRDQYFFSNTGIVGASFGYIINPTTYTKLIIGEIGNEISAHHDKVFRDAGFAVDSLKNILGYDFITTSTVMHWYVNKKISAKQTLNFGVLNNYYHANYLDSSRQYPISRQDWQYRENYKGGTDLAQAYVQYKYKPNDKLTLTAGLHGQYLSHNGSKSIEPRAAVRWNIDNNNALSLGYGLHSEMLPLYQYFAFLPPNQDTVMQNYNVDFIRSHHVVAGYDHIISDDWRMHIEAYYQYLYNVPVETRAGSSYSALDQGSTFDRDFPDTLKNTGTGYNYGAELTIQKSFSHGYYLLLTGSLFDSKAKGNDGVYRSTDYNSHFALNVLGGYERKLGRNSTFISGLKLTWAGGRLYSPPNVAASNAQNDYIVIDSLRNTLQFKPYFRLDAKLGVRINAKKVTHEIALDLVNILGSKNVLSLTYSSDLAAQGVYPFYTQYQLGFLPIFYYRLDFGFNPKK